VPVGFIMMYYVCCASGRHDLRVRQRQRQSFCPPHDAARTVPQVRWSIAISSIVIYASFSLADVDSLWYMLLLYSSGLL